MALDDPDHFTALESRHADREQPERILWNETVATLLAIGRRALICPVHFRTEHRCGAIRAPHSA